VSGFGNDKEKMIDQIVREVAYRIEKENGMAANAANAQGAVVLMTTQVPGCREAVSIIDENFGSDTEYIGFGGCKFPAGPYPAVTDADLLDLNAVYEKVLGKETLILLAPKIKLLEKMSTGDDDELAVYLATRSLLWGKKVVMLLDFEPPRFKRNTFYERVVSAVEMLEDIGIEVKTYRCVPDAEEGMLILVTERDVREAAIKGKPRIRKTAAALVTPSAKDAATELGITIDG